MTERNKMRNKHCAACELVEVCECKGIEDQQAIIDRLRQELEESQRIRIAVREIVEVSSWFGFRLKGKKDATQKKNAM